MRKLLNTDGSIHNTDRKGVSTQTMVTFNSSSDAGCLKFKFPDNIIASRFSKLSNFGGKSNNFDQVKKNPAPAFHKVG